MLIYKLNKNPIKSNFKKCQNAFTAHKSNMSCFLDVMHEKPFTFMYFQSKFCHVKFDANYKSSIFVNHKVIMYDLNNKAPVIKILKCIENENSNHLYNFTARNRV